MIGKMVEGRGFLLVGLLGVATGLGSVDAYGAGTGPRARPGWPLPIDDRQAFWRVLFDRLELQVGDGPDRVLWDAQGWYGGGFNRLWVETEGEVNVADGDGGELENFDVQYSRRFAPYWDVQAGLGYQRTFGPEPDRDRVSALIGLQGLAPYWFEVDANLRVSEDGDVSADLEAEYDWRLTQRWILQARGEALAAVQGVPELGVGNGFNSLGLGLRLRYYFTRELAPYIGVAWTRRFGETADLAEAEGEDDDSVAFVAGVRWWF